MIRLFRSLVWKHHSITAKPRIFGGARACCAVRQVLLMGQSASGDALSRTTLLFRLRPLRVFQIKIAMARIVYAPDRTGEMF
jgi:hypothetical protein